MLGIPANAPQDGAQDPPPLRPLASYSGSLAHRTYLALREAIVSLRLGPGAPLKKGEICETLGVSRSPVSDAMARLAAEGLVQIIPQAGSFVSRFSMVEIREAAFLREAIELAAIEEIAPKMTEEQLVLLRRTLRVQAALVEDLDLPGFYAQDGEMHGLILSFTGFPRLRQVADTAWVQVNRARQLILPVPGRLNETLDEHRAILAALEARDPVAARAAMRHHLRQLMKALVPLERAYPDLFDPE